MSFHLLTMNLIVLSNKLSLYLNARGIPVEIVITVNTNLISVHDSKFKTILFLFYTKHM